MRPKIDPQVAFAVGAAPNPALANNPLATAPATREPAILRGEFTMLSAMIFCSIHDKNGSVTLVAAPRYYATFKIALAICASLKIAGAIELRPVGKERCADGPMGRPDASPGVIVGFDHHSDEFNLNEREVNAELRSGCPRMAWNEKYGGFWYVSTARSSRCRATRCRTARRHLLRRRGVSQETVCRHSPMDLTHRTHLPPFPAAGTCSRHWVNPPPHCGPPNHPSPSTPLAIAG